MRARQHQKFGRELEAGRHPRANNAGFHKQERARRTFGGRNVTVPHTRALGEQSLGNKGPEGLDCDVVGR
jgi:hypothetical protein